MQSQSDLIKRYVFLADLKVVSQIELNESLSNGLYDEQCQIKQNVEVLTARMEEIKRVLEIN